jgi:hypothetical protein
MEAEALKNYLFWQLKRGQRYTNLSQPSVYQGNPSVKWGHPQRVSPFNTVPRVIADVWPKVETPAESELLTKIWAALDVPNKRWQTLTSGRDLQPGDTVILFARLEDSASLKARLAEDFGGVHVEVLAHPLDMLAQPALKAPAWATLKAIIQKCKTP